MADKIATSLALLRRLPPNKIEQNISGLLSLVPEETDELLQRVDPPLEEVHDPETGRNFLKCDYNRDGDSYRSPWSNKYVPAIDDGFTPSERLRQLEVEANDLFDAYRELYYEGGLSSVYLWDLDNGFAGCFLIKKRVDDTTYVREGCWDSIHVAEVTEEGPNKASYKLTTTVSLHINIDKGESGQTLLAGSITRQSEKKGVTLSAVHTHIANIGQMIEDMEIDTRVNVNELYIMKTRGIVNSIRPVREGSGSGPKMMSSAHVNVLSAAVLEHGKSRKVDTEGSPK